MTKWCSRFFADRTGLPVIHIHPSGTVNSNAKPVTVLAACTLASRRKDKSARRSCDLVLR
jgi:hypothetical protein